jgi:arsenite methyltransferase
MHRPVTTVIAATLGAACSATSTRGAAPTGHVHHAHGEAAHAVDRAAAHASHHGFANADELARVLDDPARDAWQRPGEIVEALQLAPGMTVADVGAGTGYFAVRLARAVPAGEVIATDIEPEMVRYLHERAQREHLSNLRAISSPQSASGLSPASVDRILIVHVWHHLADRVAYARDLGAALRPAGRLFVVDFSLDAHRGPPATMRVSPASLIAELEAAGLSAVVSPVTLPDQYLVEAHRRR